MRQLEVALLFFTDPPRAFSASVAALAPVVRAAGHSPIAVEVSRRSAINDVAARLHEMRPDVIGISTMTRDWPGANALLNRLEHEAYIIVGGYHASLAPRDVASCASVDAICIGDGERPLASLLGDLAAGDPSPPTRPGLWTRQSGTFDDPVPSADPEPDIGSLAPWDYDVFGDVQSILDEGINTFGPHSDRTLPTRAGRGCPFQCSYCSAPRWGRLQRFADREKRNTRPVDHLCDELAALRHRYRPEGFEFWDEHFPMSLEWLREFADKYPSRVGLPFKVEMHPNAATRDRLALLKQSGCVLFHCGIEAGDEEFRRDVLNRRTPDERLQRVFDDCRELGLESSASLMTMLPGETRAQTGKTTELLHRLRPGSFMWSTYQPLPGTVLGDDEVERWPGPARDTFRDHDPVSTRTPPRISAQERAQTFRELGALQSQLVQLAGRRPGATPRRARSVEVPTPMRPASEQLAAQLGLSPPGGDISHGRANAAALVNDVLTVEIEHSAFGVHQVSIAPLGTGSHFVETAYLGLSYRGKQAPSELLRLLKRMAARLETTQPHQLFDGLTDGHVTT
ncbi:MAG TPA: B12-binding domain-containing radical SAM protein, partial [Polyangiaceae bacterium]|nr:B12-binding domain-containing radical SAM protein [Polyangiaceae bacterium]